jgi:hypothetical protein
VHTGDELPLLTLEEWRETKDTLHLFLQILGKVRLAAAPPQNHWWHIAYRVPARGLAYGRMHHSGVDFDAEVDVVDHRVVFRTAHEVRTVPLHDGLSVADFYIQVMAALAELGIDMAIRAEPFGVPMTTPFPDDVEHASYDAEAVSRYFSVLSFLDRVLGEFAGWYAGKASPVHVFWHSFDLAYSRFSGRPAPDMDGVDPVTAEAYSHEVFSFGFWAGDDALPYAALYSYTAPEPDGLTEQPLLPEGAEWLHRDSGSLAVFPYAAVRTAADPRAAALDFFQSAYAAAARTARLDQVEMASSA